MINKLKSSATKVVVASLLVASLLVPAFSGTTSAAVVEGKKVSFQTLKTGTTEEQRGIKDHLVSEGIVTGKKGETKGHLTVVAKSAPMIAGMQTKQNGVFVDAAEVKHEDGTITYSFPVVEGRALESKLHVVVPAANMDKWYEYDLVMGEEIVEEVEEEKEENPTVPEVTPDKVEGQTVSFQTFKSGTTEAEPAISSHLATTGKIIEKDGAFTGYLTILAKSAPMIAGMQTKQNGTFVDATGVKNEDGTTTYSFPVVAGKVLESKLHVVVPAANMDKWYEYDLVMGEATVDEDLTGPTPTPGKDDGTNVTPGNGEGTTEIEESTVNNSGKAVSTDGQIPNPQTSDTTPYLVIIALMGSAFLLLRTKFQTNEQKS